MEIDPDWPLYKLQGSVSRRNYPYLRNPRSVTDKLAVSSKIEHGQNYFSFESYYIAKSLIKFSLFKELSKLSCLQYNRQSVNNYKHLSKIDDELQMYYSTGIPSLKWHKEYMKVNKFFLSNMYLFEECLLQLLKRLSNNSSEDSIYNTMKLVYVLVSHKSPSDILIDILLSELIPYSASEYLLVEENDFFSTSSLTFNIIRKLKAMKSSTKNNVKIIPSDQKIKHFLEIMPHRTPKGIVPTNYVLIYPTSRLYWTDRTNWTILPDYQFPGYRLDYDIGLKKSGRFFAGDEILEGDSVTFKDIISYFDTYYNFEFACLTYKYGSKILKSSLNLFDIDARCNDDLINIAHKFYREKEGVVFKEDLIWKKQAAKKDTLQFNFFFYKKYYCLLDNYIHYIDDKYSNYIKELYYQIVNDIKNNVIQLTERDDLIVVYIALKIMFYGEIPCPSQILYKHIEQILPFNRVYKRSENEWKTEILQIAVNSPFIVSVNQECLGNVNKIRKKLLSYISSKYSSFGTNQFNIKISGIETNNLAILLINQNLIKIENLKKELILEWEFDKVNIINNEKTNEYNLKIDDENIYFELRDEIDSDFFWELYNEIIGYKAETFLLATVL